ncbi:uncharacterized protein [Physcomitrium patens]|uniref:uncharacterized protein isoform X1 n=1 Tax=Physcomitrium patens TaxID=3218 RepID=UPI003CCD2E47
METSVGARSSMATMQGGLVVLSSQTDGQSTATRLAQVSSAPHASFSSSKSQSRASLRPRAGRLLRNASSWSESAPSRRPLDVVCSGLGDFAGDLLGMDLDK